MKRGTPKRFWDDAREKVEIEGRCRACGATENLEAAHISEREHDRKPPVRDEDIWGEALERKILYVHPDRIWPACGPFPAGCHGAEHRHELDTLPLLSLDEQLQAVADCGGIEQARIRTCPSAYPGRRAAGTAA